MMGKIIKNKLYLKILIADIISNFGDVLYYLALMDYALKINESNKAIAIINLSEIFPLLLSFVIGYYADNCKKRVPSIIKTLIVRTVLYMMIALITGFQPNILIVIAISLINLISDILGQYENSLYYPISHRMISNEDREEVMAIRQSISISFNILFEAIGGVAILIFSMRRLALINAATFLISMFIVLNAKKDIYQIYDEGKEQSANEEISVREKSKQIIAELKESFAQLKELPEMKGLLLSFPVLNGGLAIVSSLFVLCISEYPLFVIENSEITLSLLAVSQTAGRIVGSLLTAKAFKKISLRKGVAFVLLFNSFMFVCVIQQRIVLALICLFVSSLFTGCLDPKLGSVIFNSLDENKLATVFGGMTTYFTIGDLISKSIFSVLVLIVPSALISLFFFAISIISFIILCI